MKKNTFRLAQLAILAAISLTSIHAQMTVTGTIAGTVIDPTGQAISAAKVVATSAATSEAA